MGANVNEGLQGFSKKDFVAKLSISLKEAQETSYWLRLLKETDYITEDEFNSIHLTLIEIIKILTSILKTSRNNLIPNQN
ncbi:MAG: four helix bundle protein [Ferruginibacter sp.]|nr:four helix bundle protein [Ferruginibacter sp.]MCC7377975.1 four helix bundle protein [Chitinophagaceae bacterium]